MGAIESWDDSASIYRSIFSNWIIFCWVMIIFVLDVFSKFGRFFQKLHFFWSSYPREGKLCSIMIWSVLLDWEPGLLPCVLQETLYCSKKKYVHRRHSTWWSSIKLGSSEYYFIDRYGFCVRIYLKKPEKSRSCRDCLLLC